MAHGNGMVQALHGCHVLPLWGILPSGWQVSERAGWTMLLGLFWSELSHGPLSKFVVHMMTYKFH